MPNEQRKRSNRAGLRRAWIQATTLTPWSEARSASRRLAASQTRSGVVGLLTHHTGLVDLHQFALELVWKLVTVKSQSDRKLMLAWLA
jgi:hypothetical protein